MKDLVMVLGVGGCLLLWAGAAVAKPTVQLHCSKTSCQYTEEIGPLGTKTYEGYCDGTGNTKVTEFNSHMYCHAVKGLTCAGPAWQFMGTHPFWSCTCTNWNTTHEAHIDIDISCPAPS